MIISEEVAAQVVVKLIENIDDTFDDNMVLSQKDETEILEIADDINELLSEDKDVKISFLDDKTEIEIGDKSNGILYTEIYDIDKCLLSTKFDNEELDGAETPNDEKFNITRT
eukprot:477951_1